MDDQADEAGGAPRQHAGDQRAGDQRGRRRPAGSELGGRIAEHLRARADVTEQAIVGGLGYTWRGNLVCGVLGEDLLVRVGKGRFDDLATRPGARPMVMAGRASRAWIVVDAAHVVDDLSLAGWLDHAIDFVATLPAR